MPDLSIYTAKQFLRIDHDQDDFLVERLLNAATAYVLSLCDPFVDEEGDTVDPPDDVQQAIYFLVSHWYDSRGIIHQGRAGGTGEIPFTVSALIANHRSSFDEDD
jgi:uncharacterized phage protein (predicted DNA packaging)